MQNPHIIVCMNCGAENPYEKIQAYKSIPVVTIILPGESIEDHTARSAALAAQRAALRACGNCGKTIDRKVSVPVIITP